MTMLKGIRTMIRTVNLQKTFRTEDIETTALNDIGIHIAEGEFVGIMGPSGCGKSTLLKKHNARCYTCAADQFRVWNRANGKVMNGLTKRRAAERQVYMS